MSDLKNGVPNSIEKDIQVSYEKESTASGYQIFLEKRDRLRMNKDAVCSSIWWLLFCFGGCPRNVI